MDKPLLSYDECGEYRTIAKLNAFNITIGNAGLSGSKRHRYIRNCAACEHYYY